MENKNGRKNNYGMSDERANITHKSVKRNIMMKRSVTPYRHEKYA